MIDLRLGDCLEVMKEIPDKYRLYCYFSTLLERFEYEAYFNSYKQYLDWCELWLKECKRVLNQMEHFG